MNTFIICVVSFSFNFAFAADAMLPYFLRQYDHHYRVQPVNSKGQQLRQASSDGVETIIEKHELFELPTQIEIIREGHPFFIGQSGENEQTPKSKNMITDDKKAKNQFIVSVQFEESDSLQTPQASNGILKRNQYLPNVEDVAKSGKTTTEMPTVLTMNGDGNSNSDSKSYSTTVTTSSKMSSHETKEMIDISTSAPQANSHQLHHKRR
uniref:Uncharacterized protein n=1 Tax=Glossina palpalis gambiensis TaxID=67801 RepID=A0A1B0B6U6_9MUSC